MIKAFKSRHFYIWFRKYRDDLVETSEFDDIIYEMEQCGPFSAMDLFDVRTSTIGGIVSTVITYLIALLQFPGAND